MAIDILMPALSPTMESGTLSKWTIAVGDPVRSGDVIAEIETDKATMEVEAVDDGVLASILVADGSDGVAVGTVIARLAEDGEAVEDVASAAVPPPGTSITSASIIGTSIRPRRGKRCVSDRCCVSRPCAGSSRAGPNKCCGCSRGSEGTCHIG